MNPLVTMEERKWIRDNATVTHGSDKILRFKVIDLPKVVDRIRQERERAGLTTLINIVPVAVDKYKKPNRSFTYQRDPNTGVYYGILLKEDQYGGLVWQRVTISDGLPLNIERDDDAKIWAVIRFNPNIMGSPFQSDSPFYRVDDPVEQANIEIRRAELITEAFTKIVALSADPKSMVHFARFLGEDVHESSNLNVVRSQLYKVAQHAPADFINKWNSNRRTAGEIFTSGVALGIIANYPDRGYLYNNIPIGLDEAEALNYLMKDPKLLSAINMNVLENDKVISAIEKELDSKGPGRPKDDGDDDKENDKENDESKKDEFD